MNHIPIPTAAAAGATPTVGSSTLSQGHPRWNGKYHNPPSSEVYYILRLGYHFFKMGNHILRWVIYWAIIFIIFYDGKPYFFPVKHLWGIAKWCQMDHQETWRCFWGSLVLAPRSYRELTKSYQSFPTFLHVFTVINPGFCTKQNTSWSSWCFQIIWFKLPDSNISNAPLCITFAAEQEQGSHHVLQGWPLLLRDLWSRWILAASMSQNMSIRDVRWCSAINGS